jgi:hypothetical protein
MYLINVFDVFDTYHHPCIMIRFALRWMGWSDLQVGKPVEDVPSILFQYVNKLPCNDAELVITRDTKSLIPG